MFHTGIWHRLPRRLPLCPRCPFGDFPTIAALFNFPFRLFDVSAAYLHGDIDEELYMEVPPGCESHRLARDSRKGSMDSSRLDVVRAICFQLA